MSAEQFTPLDAMLHPEDPTSEPLETPKRAKLWTLIVGGVATTLTFFGATNHLKHTETPHTLVTIDDLQCTNPATDESRPAAVERINDRRFDPKFSGTNNQLDEVVFKCPEGLILNEQPTSAVQQYTKKNWLEHADKPRLHLKGLAPAEAAVQVSIVTDGDGRPVQAVIATPSSGSISAARGGTLGN